MLIEKIAILSDAQAISANDTWSEEFFDMGSADNGYAINGNLYLIIRVNTAPTDTGDTCAIQVQCSATNDGTNLTGTIKNLFTVCDDGLAELAVTDDRLSTAGADVITIPLPYQTDLRYVQLNYLQGTSNGTQTYDAFVGYGPDYHGEQVTESNVGTPAVA